MVPEHQFTSAGIPLAETQRTSSLQYNTWALRTRRHIHPCTTAKTIAHFPCSHQAESPYHVMTNGWTGLWNSYDTAGGMDATVGTLKSRWRRQSKTKKCEDDRFEYEFPEGSMIKFNGSTPFRSVTLIHVRNPVA